jgi:hypothetical protein
MAIVGSRGLGKLKGILLGSTSHYLVQKSSVPVMVSAAGITRDGAGSWTDETGGEETLAAPSAQDEPGGSQALAEGQLGFG